MPLIDVHRGLKIAEEQRRRFVELHVAATDLAELPNDPAFRQALRDHVELGTAVVYSPAAELEAFAGTHNNA